MTDSHAFDLNKSLVRHAFNLAAPTYDDAAVLQREVANRLNERLDFIKLLPEVILEVGSGTGYFSELLHQRYPKSRKISLDIAHNMLVTARNKLSWLQKLRRPQHWLCADIERLPLATQSLDMVVSNLTLQWSSDLESSFSNIHRCLKPGGLFMFTTFGPDTLKELRASWRHVDDYNHVNAFIDMHDIGDALLRSGFSDPVMDVEHITLTYKEVTQLMRELKAIGAHNVTAGRQRGLTGRAKLQKLISAYEQFRRDGVLPCTYEIIYGHAWRGDKAPANTPDRNEVRITLDAIKRL